MQVIHTPVRWAGPALITIGALHTCVMLALFHPVYVEMISAGLWNTVHEQTYEMVPVWGAAAWTLIFGFMLIFAGLLLPKDRKPVSKVAAIAFICIVLLGIVIMPTGGFWLGIPVALGLLVRG